jgi:hypothetical protein
MSNRISVCMCLCLFAACQHQPSPPSRATADEREPSTQPAERASDKHEGAPLQLGSADQDAAADVIRRYYAAIAAHDYRTAYALWWDQGRASRQSFEAFQAGFANTRTTRVEVAQPGAIEGAAGSLYITIPVTVRAGLTDGAAQTFIGSYALRRVNDVEGSSADERKWHIHSASLHEAK